MKHSQKKFLILGVAFALVGTGVGFFYEVSVDQRSPSAEAGMGRLVIEADESVKTNAIIEGLKKELDETTKQEMENGCMTTDERSGQRILCGASKEKVEALHQKLLDAARTLQAPSEDRFQETQQAIRALREKPDVNLTFDGESGNPYFPSGRRVMEVYRDQDGFEYWVDQPTRRIVQFGPGPNSEPFLSSQSEKSVEELEQIAINYLERYFPEFKDLRTTMTLERMTKGGDSTAFRWTSKEESDLLGQPGYLQVVLLLGGEVAAFNDLRF